MDPVKATRAHAVGNRTRREVQCLERAPRDHPTLHAREPSERLVSPTFNNHNPPNPPNFKAVGRLRSLYDHNPTNVTTGGRFVRF